MLPAIGVDHRFGVERAVIEPVDQTASIGRQVDEARDLPMDPIDILLLVSPSGDASLVGHDHEPVSGIAEASKAFGDAVEKRHPGGITEVAVVGDEGVVTIEKNNRFHGGSGYRREVGSDRPNRGIQKAMSSIRLGYSL